MESKSGVADDKLVETYAKLNDARRELRIARTAHRTVLLRIVERADEGVPRPGTRHMTRAEKILASLRDEAELALRALQPIPNSNETEKRMT